ncbi:MAG TPA: hypothetical protein VMF64_05965 [Steroidobacteraceae bacterium]|nr:hypothetical protein [Steroidobacteraceae bacterium]
MSKRGWTAMCCAAVAGTILQAAPAPPLAAARSTEAPAAKSQLARTQASKRAVIAYSRAFYLQTTTMAQRLDALAPDYVEHAPMFARFNQINHVQGRDGMRLLLETLSRLRGGGPPVGPVPGAAGSALPPGNVLYQVVAEGDRVTVLNQQYRPDPQHPGSFYKIFLFDAFRVDAQGRIAEHWDYTTIPADPPIFLRVPAAKLHYPKARRPIYGVSDATANDAVH